MKTEGTNSLVLTISAFWSSSRWPRATKMSSRRQRSIPLGGRYRQVSLYIATGPRSHKTPVLFRCSSPPHSSDVIMGAMTSHITGVSVIYSTVCSGADQRKYQSFTSFVSVRGIHRWPVNSPHKGPVTRKKFPFDGVIMLPRNSENKHIRLWQGYEKFSTPCTIRYIYSPINL